MQQEQSDLSFCAPEQPVLENFNSDAEIPFGVSVENIFRAMVDFTDFLRAVDTELVRKQMTRLEDMLMPANFSSMVGEFITANLQSTARQLRRTPITMAIPICFPQANIRGTPCSMWDRMALKSRRLAIGRDGRAQPRGRLAHGFRV